MKLFSEAFFKKYSLGVSTNRDDSVYDFSESCLIQKSQEFCDSFAMEAARIQRKRGTQEIDRAFAEAKIKLSRNLKRSITSGNTIEFTREAVRKALYRPFTIRHLYFDEIAVDERGLIPRFFPSGDAEIKNRLIAVTGPGSEKPFMVLLCAKIPDLHVVGAGAGAQCFPFYTYDEVGSNRSENITDWALKLFRDKYDDKKISKWDIFHYCYGLLHHQGYREKFADSLKRELPRIPLAKTLDDFRAFRDAGKALAKLHVEYESLEPWKLKWIETHGQPLSYRVKKMKLAKDKKSILVNDSLALEGIPPEVFDYRLGNRSALDWVIDQYQVSTDKRSGITSDPNRPDDPEYIVRLVGQVIRVSVETVKVVNALPKSYGGPP